MEINIKICEKEKSYPVIINNGDISALYVEVLGKGQKVLAVFSEKVEKLYGKMLPFENKFILKDGEVQKNFKNWQRILDAAFRAGLSRKDAIAAVGGGVVGDLAGFAAASYMRGIDLIQVPTTLLACIDSSVGGKTAFNLKQGKNLIGAFHQPKAVLINANFLKTLDERQFKSGLGEAVKYAFIDKNGNLINFLNQNAEKILQRDTETLAALIEACVSIKASVVRQDEKESGLRRILNFGHTYGHAAELETGYKKYTHGEAVAFGMRYAFGLAVEKGLIDREYACIAADLMKKFGFECMPEFPKTKMLKHMLGDKKASGDKIIFILPVGYAKVDAFEINPKEL